MKKKLISMLLAGAMVMTALTGCGGSAQSTSTDAAPATTEETEAAAPAAETETTGEEVEISFYTTETGKDQMFQDIIADFESKNPGIHVEYIAAGDDQLQQWMALYSSNEGPTVSLMDPINIWENQERMLEFTGMSFVDNIEPSALSTMTFDGKVYAVPQTAAGVGLLYNKAVCDAAVGGDFDPSTIKTRSDLEDLFKKIEATGVDATCFTGVNWSLGSHFLCQVYGAAIGSTEERVAYVNSIIAGETKEIDNDVFNGYMDTFDMMAKYNHNQADPLVGDVNIDAAALAAGECGTWYMGDWAWTFLGPIVTEDQEFGLLPIPHSDDSNDPLNQSIATSFAKGYCVDKSQNTEAQQAAGLKFVEYITSDSYAEEQMAKVCGQALPYKNAQVTIESPLGLSTASYIANGKTYDFYGTPNLCPSDIWYECGAYMCEYLAGASDRETLAAKIDEYWSHQEAR
ncbi:MAG: carbohydrate ABC transporter substrate-binding protein [Lachnospiraceae bacterium]|nr:carbohydrate ABC transporter substrate-binding protein [Lachnospiraceae bacterium]